MANENIKISSNDSDDSSAEMNVRLRIKGNSKRE